MSFQPTPPSTIPSLKLFYSPGACSFVPHVALLEAHLPVETILARVGSMSAEFTAINPKRRVPVLVIDNEIITEMAAVLTAIHSLAPGAQLFGKSTLETIRVYEWLNWLSTVAHAQAVGSIWRSERFTNNVEHYGSIKARGMEVVQEVYEKIEGHIAETERVFAVGEGFTVVDPFFVVLYCWGFRFWFEMGDKYPAYRVYAERLLQRESFRKAREVHVDISV
ncbi:hypothetical protein BDW74DRAFT_183827 [Aspergillus multicolor]|uniref:glutathione S-transferase family protein n=1 Tax=Aspergillus multicolor TaxID=41759 RepID=UPI003CCDF2E9